MMETGAYPVAELLPHSGNLVLLDSVLACDEQCLTARLQVRADGLLPGNPASVPAWFGIEYMAQAIGAYAGLKAKQEGKPIRLGFLLGTRLYRSNVPAFATGTWLTVEVERIIHDEQLSVFDCRIKGDAVDVTAKLNVYQPPDLNNE